MLSLYFSISDRYKTQQNTDKYSKFEALDLFSCRFTELNWCLLKN